jgi:hypothetical protein
MTTRHNPFASIATRLSDTTRTIDLTAQTLPGQDRAEVAEAYRQRAEECARVGKFALASDYLRVMAAIEPKQED